MSSKHQIPHSILRNALNIADQLPPLKTKKNPAIAAVAGFMLGGIGLAVYLRSFPDFYIPCLILLVLVILGIFTAGLPLFFIPFFWAFYGWRRVTASNKKLDAQDGIIDAEVIITQPPTMPIPAGVQAFSERNAIPNRTGQIPAARLPEN
jgi:hypothetical protein